MAIKVTDVAAHRLLRDQVERLQRLTRQAEWAGACIVSLYRTDKHLAIDPYTQKAYAVNTEHCSCRDFGIWGACGHHMLLLAELGQLPDPANEIGWPEEADKPLPTWEQRSTGVASVVALKLGD
jgi:hypothetical protein